MKRASNPLMEGSSKKTRARVASCFSHSYRSVVTSAQRLRKPVESTNTTSKKEWNEFNNGCGRERRRERERREGEEGGRGGRERREGEEEGRREGERVEKVEDGLVHINNYQLIYCYV